MLSAFADETLPLEERSAALQRYRELPSGRERPGRYWRIDLDAIPVDELPFDGGAGSVRVECADDRVRIGGVPRGFGTTAARTSKFGALASAFANRYAFVEIPAGIEIEAPIQITYRAPEHATLFPYTCVHAERGARATIVERIEGGSGSFICGITEAILDENADLTIASLQNLPSDARLFSSRAALPGKDATLAWATADLGAALAVVQIDVELLASGADAQIVSLFFPQGAQHVDMRSTIDHRAGDATSFTMVKSAAVGRGQARYVGNIRIAAHAQGSDASLRDDALLLSPNAHIDSVPALEIAANDVKAYHGATVGALDQETLFYMTTRGLEREEAERMVTLGFFEPAIDRFPAQLRDELREALAAKVLLS
ncbi:MAG TPA: Fe-S cluster assembly protein SufD [Candidatus Tyrphobacter sp.]